MIELAASDTLAGVAGTGTAVTYTLRGDQITAGVDAWGRAAQGQLPTSAATLYTATGVTALLSSINMANVTALPVPGVKLFQGGLLAANQITPTITLPASGGANFDGKHLEVYDGTGSVLYSIPVTLTGDVTGSGNGTLATTVVKIQGSAVSASAPSTGNALVWNGTSWTPTTVVQTIAAGDTSIAVGGTVTARTLTTGRVDQIFTAQPPTAAVNFNGQEATNAATPTTAASLATKQYVDSLVAGLPSRPLCNYATSAALPTVLYVNGVSGVGATLTAVAPGVLTVDGVAQNTLNTPILVKDQASTFQNGIYTLTTVGTVGVAFVLTRRTDFDTGAEMQTTVLVPVDDQGGAAGLVNDDKVFLSVTVNPFTVGTSGITFQVIGSVYTADETSIHLTGTVFSRMALTGDATAAAGAGAVAVVKLQGNAISVAAPSTSQALVWSGTAWTPTAVVNTVTNSDGTLTISPTSGAVVASRPAITGDATIAGGSNASVVARIQGTPVDVTPPTNGQVLQYVSASGKWIPFSYAGDVSGGPSASTVVRLQGTAVSATVPNVGMDMRFGPTSWQPTSNQWNIVNFGADPTAAVPSTLAIYNAHISCAIAAGSAYLVTSGTPTTSTSSFNITVTANAAFPSTGTGTLVAQTTRGLVYMTFTGGTTTTVAATVVAGVAGGTILAGSIMGIYSTSQVGGIVYYPAGLWLTDQPVINSIPGVHEAGVAGTTTADVGSFVAAGGSWLYYNGPLGDFIMTHVPISGTANYQQGENLKGIQVTDLNFAASGTSLGYGYCQGLRLLSCVGWYAKNLFVNEPAFLAYEFSTLGAGMLGEAADCTRGTAINLRFRCLAGPAATAAQISAAGTAITAGAGTNINTFAGAGTIATAALTAAAWPAGTGGVGLAYVQAIDQLTGNVMDYLVSYTGNAGPGLTGVTTLGLWWNQANATTLAAAAPATGNPKPNALLFAGALVRPAYAAWAIGMRMHGSLTANTSINTFLRASGAHWMGAAAYLGNSDTNHFHGMTWNRSTAGTPTGIGWDVQGCTAIGFVSGQAVAVSRNNVWWGGDPGSGGVNIRGTNSYGYTGPATPNRWISYELGNGAPIPVVGTGAYFTWEGNGTFTPGPIGVVSTTTQAVPVAVTLITGTSVPVPPQGFQIGTTLKFTIKLAKTAAGVAAWQAICKIGTANTTADAAISTITSLANTAAIDAGTLTVTVIVDSLGAAATARVFWHLDHVLTATTGLGALTGQVTLTPCVVTTATFNSTAPAQFIHIDFTPGAAAVMSVYQAFAECVKAGNP